jgi:hypothetical protein
LHAPAAPRCPSLAPPWQPLLHARLMNMAARVVPPPARPLLFPLSPSGVQAHVAGRAGHPEPLRVGVKVVGALEEQRGPGPPAPATRPRRTPSRGPPGIVWAVACMPCPPPAHSWRVRLAPSRHQTARHPTGCSPPPRPSSSPHPPTGPSPRSRAARTRNPCLGQQRRRQPHARRRLRTSCRRPPSGCTGWSTACRRRRRRG